jgi:uncharacterized protein
MKQLCRVLMVYWAFHLGSAFAQDFNAIFANANPADDTALAAKGDNKAHLRLGYRFLTGAGGVKDARRASLHFAAAQAQSRWPSASAWLGFAYAVSPELGKTVQGIVLLQDAAGGGDPVAKTLLGRLHQTGAGVPKDLNAARNLYLEAASRFALAQTYLAEIYLNAPDRSPADCSAAHALLTKAAGAGEARSMVHLAFYHQQGFGGQPDLGRAVYWLNRAVERGDSVAIYQRGVFYSKGWGGSRSERMAAALFRRAADMGYAPAQAALGLCYATGTGIEPDLNQARKWLGAAASRDAFAARQLALLEARARESGGKK